MAAPVFDSSDLDTTLPDLFRTRMLEVIMAFARLDTALSAWVVAAYDVRKDHGAFLIENFSTSQKVSRLKRLYQHRGHIKAVNALKSLSKGLDEHSFTRNTIAHATYAGILKSEPTVAVFSPYTGSIGSAEQLDIVKIPADEMRRATLWALQCAETAMKLYEMLGGRPERRGE